MQNFGAIYIYFIKFIDTLEITHFLKCKNSVDKGDNFVAGGGTAQTTHIHAHAHTHTHTYHYNDNNNNKLDQSSLLLMK